MRNPNAARIGGAFAAIVLALLINAAIAHFAPASPAPPSGWLPAPPGWFVGAVWTVLFGLLGAAAGDAARRDRAAAWAIAGLVVLCAAYPLYTAGLRDARIGLAGNVLTGIAALAVAVRTVRFRPLGAAPVAVVAWLAYATGTLVTR